MEHPLQELIDRDQIWRVLQCYSRGLDRLDRALVRSCYWDDAIEDHGDFVGYPDDFIEWADRATLSFKSTQHGLLNHVCELRGEEAYCETYYLFSGVTGGDTDFLATGRYIDHFQRRDGVWRIANRVRVLEGKFDIPSSNRGTNLASANSVHDSWRAERDKSDVSYHRPLVPRRPARSV